MTLIQLSFVWELIENQVAATSWLEWVGTISGFACVYLAARQNIWTWPVTIISVVAYAFLFYDFKLYGDAALQLYFLATALYGWYYWSDRHKEHKKPIVSLNHADILKVATGSVVLTFVLGWFLDNYTDTNVPYADGFCTALSFIAQLLMTRKVLQNWILWIIVDICYVPLYIYKELYLTSVLYALFLVLAVMGYMHWKRTSDLMVEKAAA